MDEDNANSGLMWCSTAVSSIPSCAERGTHGLRHPSSVCRAHLSRMSWVLITCMISPHFGVCSPRACVQMSLKFQMKCWFPGCLTNMCLTRNAACYSGNLDKFEVKVSRKRVNDEKNIFLVDNTCFQIFELTCWFLQLYKSARYMILMLTEINM